MAYTARKESEVKEYFDEPSELQSKIKKLAELVKKSKHFVVYTGAGISTSCGIADYRSGLNTVLETGAGKWAKEAAAKQGKLSREAVKKMNKAQKAKKVSTFKAIPSPSHMALVALAQKGYLKHLVSQNTDGLHRRSGFPINQLSELHGNSTLEECPICSKVYMRDFKCRNKGALPGGSLSRLKFIADQIQTAMSATSKYSAFITNDDRESMTTRISEIYEFIRNQREIYKEINKKNLMTEIKGNKVTTSHLLEAAKAERNALLEQWEKILNKAGFKLPRYLHVTGRHCAVNGCDGMLTDTIINFGESLPEQTLETAQNESSKSDLYLVLGSSCTVTPAADMPEEVGKKWRKEKKKNKDKDTVHNLSIVNIQKTPLHHLCSLPIHSKIDDVMIGLMKELNLEIPEWTLQRYIKLKVCDINQNQKRLSISGCDLDGTPFSLFKSVVLRKNGKRIRKIINNKENRDDQYNFMLTTPWNEKINDDEKEKKQNDDDDDKINGLSVELEFWGNYEETKLILGLNEYLDDFLENEGEIVLKMMMNPSTKIWNVPNKKQQSNDKDVSSLWYIGKKEENDNGDDQKEDN